MEDILRQETRFSPRIFHNEGLVNLDIKECIFASMVLGGERFMELIGKVPVYVGEYSCCIIPDDKSTPMLMFRGTDISDVMKVVHETAHAFHAYFLPDLTAAASDDQCEAVAHMAERRLAYLYPKFQGAVRAQSRFYSRDTIELLSAFEGHESADFLVTAQGILNGP